MISKKLAKWIAYHPKTVLIVCLILIIPSIIGYFLTGVNYDICHICRRTLNPFRASRYSMQLSTIRRVHLL